MFNKSADISCLCVNCFNELSGSGAVCPKCGYAETEPPPHVLAPRSILAGKYFIGRVLGEGGFGVTYVGWDLNLDVKVAIKEYYPNGNATRSGGSTIYPLTGAKTDLFSAWRDKFIDEAKNLAKFYSLPGIVSVKDYFQENGTAYIVMEFAEGVSLKQKLAENGGKLPVSQVSEYMKPVIKSLAEVHAAGIIHRDISPDNLMVSPEGNVKLIDFGAARSISDGQQSLSVLLKPGFAPEEQYRTRGVQGAFTDVYALCATMYRCVTGVTPDEALERMQDDRLKMPSALGIVVAPEWERAIAKGLSVFAKDRPANMAELYNALYDPQPAPTAPHVKPAPAPVTPAPEKKKIKLPFIIGGAAAGLVVLFTLIGLLSGEEKEPSPSPTPSVTATAAPTPSPNVTPTPVPSSSEIGGYEVIAQNGDWGILRDRENGSYWYGTLYNGKPEAAGMRETSDGRVFIGANEPLRGSVSNAVIEEMTITLSANHVYGSVEYDEYTGAFSVYNGEYLTGVSSGGWTLYGDYDAFAFLAQDNAAFMLGAYDGEARHQLYHMQFQTIFTDEGENYLIYTDGEVLVVWCGNVSAEFNLYDKKIVRVWDSDDAVDKYENEILGVMNYFDLSGESSESNLRTLAEAGEYGIYEAPDFVGDSTLYGKCVIGEYGLNGFYLSTSAGSYYATVMARDEDDEGRFFSYNGDGTITCYDTRNWEVIWDFNGQFVGGLQGASGEAQYSALDNGYYIGEVSGGLKNGWGYYYWNTGYWSFGYWKDDTQNGWYAEYRADMDNYFIGKAGGGAFSGVVVDVKTQSIWDY